MKSSSSALPNLRLQRTRATRSPLSRQPLGGSCRLGPVVLLALVSLGVAIALPWSSRDPASVIVRVRDQLDAPLPGATVVLVHAAGGEVARAVTSSTGEVQLYGLPVEQLEVHSELAGLQPDYAALVRLKAGRVARVTITMSVDVRPGGPVVGDPVVTPTKAPK
jgi:hypothetical protein